MVTFLHLCIVKRKGYHIVITPDIRLLFTRISVKRSMYVDIQKRVIKCWNKKRALILAILRLSKDQDTKVSHSITRSKDTFLFRFLQIFSHLIFLVY